MKNLDDTFGAWLKLVLPDSGIQERDLRVGVIREFASTASAADIIELVLAFYCSATDHPTMERLRSAMRVIDTSFGVKDDSELAVVAAGILFELLDNGGELAATAALAILCAEFGALGKNDHVEELVTKALHFVGDEGVRVREQGVRLPSLRKALGSVLDSRDGQEHGGSGDGEDPEEESDEDDIEKRLRDVIRVFADYGDKIEQSLTSIEARRAEQSDILYWLLSGRRHITGIPLRGLKKEEVAIFVAIELAKLTRQIPGPASAAAILSSFLEQCKNPDVNEVTLEACVKSIEPIDGTRYLASRNVVHPVITPISFAILKAEETGWNDGWQSAFKAQTLRTSDIRYSVLNISEQLYREALLSRALEERTSDGR